MTAWPKERLDRVLRLLSRETVVDPVQSYRLLGIRLDGLGPFHRETVLGAQTSAAKFYQVKTGDFIYSRLFAWRGREFTHRCRAERGDVLYSKDGATKGRPCYIDTDEEFSFFVSVALLKPLRDSLDDRFLVHLLNSSWIRDRMIDKSRGDMIPHIVLREIRAFPVPLPPLSEQHRIVAESVVAPLIF
jgi:Type I restriction modification DNA specificity domain